MINGIYAKKVGLVDEIGTIEDILNKDYKGIKVKDAM